MAKFGLGSIKKGLEKTTGLLKDSVQNLPESVKEINVSDSVKQLAKKSSETLDTLKEKAEAVKKENSRQKQDRLGIREALMIMYYLIAADGEIVDDEQELFHSIGVELDSDFTDYKEEIIKECHSCLEKSNDKEEYADDLRVGVNEAIRKGKVSSGKDIKYKHLIWNLYSIAYCDGECSDEEIKLIRYIVRTLGFDKDICMEMEQALQAILAIERESEWIKKSNRSYAVAETHLNELSERKQVVMQSIYALIAD